MKADSRRPMAPRPDVPSASARTSSALLQQLVERMPVAAWRTDGDLRILERHPDDPARFPWTETPARRITRVQETFVTDDRPSPLLELHQRALRGEVASGEVARGRRTFDVTVSPTTDAGGITGTLATAIEITARREQEQAIRASERMYRRLVEESPEAIAVHSEGVIRFANRAAAALYGVGEPDELIGQSVLAFIPDTHREVTQAQLDALYAARREPAPVEWRVRRADGEERDVELVAARVSFEGRPAMLTIVRDVTARKQREETARQLAEQLRRADKMDAVGRLAGAIAHDFNNLLAIIRSYSDFLLASEQLATDARADISEIREAADRAAALTQQLLVFSRHGAPTPKPTDMNAIVENAQRMVARLLPASVSMRTVLAPRLPTVFGDRGQLEQAMLNLLLNARDAMPHGGAVTVRTSVVTLDGARARALGDAAPGAYVRVVVQDSGTGMSRETLAHIFEPFFTTKPEGEGTGLGLSTVYGVVRASGGRVDVHSAPGKGTRMELYLPAAEEVREP